ncbi:2854_t:CDS:1, partial [Ambispora gerdemannii]
NHLEDDKYQNNQKDEVRVKVVMIRKRKISRQLKKHQAIVTQMS